MDYWQVPASLAVTWWQALGYSHHARALAIRQAVLLLTPHQWPGVSPGLRRVRPQAVIEVLEALVDEGQLLQSQATAPRRWYCAMSTGKANGVKHNAALSGRCMERALTIG